MAPTPQDLEEAVPAASGTAADEAASKQRLSVVSKKYDIHDDGELDEAALAMRNLDKSGRGYLTNDKVYGLMQEQIKLQKEMFKFKKIIFGLIGLVVLLALSNLGTSFASAILAKDTTTNTNNELVDKNTGEAVGTQTAVDMFDAYEPSDQSSRKLSCTGGSDTECTIDSYVQVSLNDGKKMIQKCSSGKTVVLRKNYNAFTKLETICAPGVPGCTHTITNGATPSANLCNGVSITPNSDGTSYSVSGDVATSNLDEPCESNDDCDLGYECLDAPPTAGDQAIPAYPEPCNDDGTCNQIFDTCIGRDVAAGIAGNCTQCDPDDAQVYPSSYCTTLFGNEKPLCVSTGMGGGYCSCNVNGQADTTTCPGAGETCSTPVCVGTEPYCAVNHNEKFDCKVCSTPTATTTLATKVATEATTVP